MQFLSVNGPPVRMATLPAPGQVPVGTALPRGHPQGVTFTTSPELIDRAVSSPWFAPNQTMPAWATEIEEPRPRVPERGGKPPACRQVSGLAGEPQASRRGSPRDRTSPIDATARHVSESR